MREQLVGSGFTDWDEVHEVVADAYFPHDLRPLSRDDAARSSLESTELGPSRLARIGFGAAVSIESDHPGAYGINIPLAGHIVSVTGAREVTSTPGFATICPPDTRTVITDWSSSCEIIGFKVERDYLQREMDRVLARPGRQLPRQLDLRSGAGAEWLGFVRSVADQALHNSILLQSDQVSRQLCGALTTALVLAAMPDDDAGASGIRPRIVKRVVDAIQQDPARPWTAGEMAELVDVSVRRMQQGFREYVGMTPMEYLSDVRLERVHADLTASVSPTTVSDVASRWGVMHTGRFAAAYRRKYGVTPSDTLRGGES
ncbi:AraC family transcriptional regulator [Rhodococcus oxybenzonivorans]|uniref:AraC family transcriptional regulator n=1 Tax=Rhodococcus oxybenzonivorans TaxID=1990687 RepID=A0A2S2C1Q2_9NOCA|nr:AraC family transcriptional regulator [Rhodococcus oxybenzonivorans]AWK74753.1 AraC family transcriptional regulator [Rhodococcus oxybenzonivorans]